MIGPDGDNSAVYKRWIPPEKVQKQPIQLESSSLCVDEAEIQHGGGAALRRVVGN